MNVIRVELTSTGVDTCTAANITAHSHTPVLTLCRKMIAAGIDPATELQVFRGDTLALTIPVSYTHLTLPTILLV